jgi:hypothetical protein
MVVLSTHTERTQISVSNDEHESGNGKRHRYAGVKNSVAETKRA